MESLIARQNVLFEDFAGQQAQTLREIQRSLASGGRTGNGPGGAVAPIVLPKVGVFLDVPNVVFAADDAGVRVHFGKLLDYLTQGRQLVRATAYAPITDDPNTRFENQRFVHPVLGNGYKVVTKPWKRFADGGMKANFDIELAVDILTMSDRLDIVVLLSGDSDFKRVLELVESKGVRVEVCAFAASTASELPRRGGPVHRPGVNPAPGGALGQTSRYRNFGAEPPPLVRASLAASACRVASRSTLLRHGLRTNGAAGACRAPA